MRYRPKWLLLIRAMRRIPIYLPFSRSLPLHLSLSVEQTEGGQPGSQQSSGRSYTFYPVITDDDMLATPTWFGSITRMLVKNGAGNVVTGQVLTAEEDDRGGYAPSTREDEQVVIYAGRVNRDILFSGNMAIYKSTFQAVGGFDTRLGPGTVYPAAEDNDFAFRLLEAGCHIIYDPQPCPVSSCLALGKGIYLVALELWLWPGRFLRQAF
jgi:hypothetical protein